MALLSVLAVASLASASAYSEGNIYPSGHFTFSTGLTKASFEWVAEELCAIGAAHFESFL